MSSLWSFQPKSSGQRVAKRETSGAQQREVGALETRTESEELGICLSGAI